MGFRSVGLLVSILVFATAGTAPAAPPRTTFVESFDGTRLYTHFFPADGLGPGERAPVAMLAHGFGEAAPATRNKRMVGMPLPGALIRAGYNVLTWDARGHASSEGEAQFADPDVEGRDVEALIDWAARQPETELDAAGDPRLGMSGASYGGLIQFIAAARDRRIDVISPSYTGYSLADLGFAQNEELKETWIQLIFGVGLETTPVGVISPGGPQLHSVTPEFGMLAADSVMHGQMRSGFKAFLDRRSPFSFLDRVRVPTMIRAGTIDGLFPLVNAIRTFRELKRAGVPVKMVWNCEGHTECASGRKASNPARFDAQTVRWFDRWLKRDTSAGTGAPFEWLADNAAAHHSAGMFPPPVVKWLTGSGSGSLPISWFSPAATAGSPLSGSSPSSEAVAVAVPPPSAEVEIVGAPRMRLRYAGNGLPVRTHIYAQLVDAARGRVVGAQATPIPVLLDGRSHTLTTDLNAIATHGTPASRYRVELFAGTLTMAPQRTNGSVDLDEIEVSLPVIAPGAAPKLRIGRAKWRRGKSRELQVEIEAKRERFRDVRVTAFSTGPRARRISRSGQPIEAGPGGRRVVVRLRKQLVPGRYEIRVTGTDPYGERGSARSAFRVRAIDER